MREILFRGKRKYSGDWVQGYYYLKRGRYASEKTFVYEAHTITTGIEETRGAYGESTDHIEYEVLPETVGQYTGLTVNGTMIFEGDIVKYKEFYKFSDDEDLEDAEQVNETIGVVKFANGRFVPLPTRRNCEDYYYSYAEDDFEVIGNIHDNPELLKGGAE